MKTYILLILIVTFTLNTTSFAAPQSVDAPKVPAHQPATEKFLHIISFRNAGDVQGTLPFLSISFNGVTKEQIKTINLWHTEMEKKIRSAGAVTKEADYSEKVGPILVEYATKFMESGAESVFISFDRIRKGFLMQKKK